MPHQAVVQVGGDALKVPAKVLQKEFARGGLFQHVVLLYTQALITQNFANGCLQPAAHHRAASLPMAALMPRPGGLLGNPDNAGAYCHHVGFAARRRDRSRRAPAGRWSDSIFPRSYQDHQSERPGGDGLRVLSDGRRRTGPFANVTSNKRTQRLGDRLRRSWWRKYLSWSKLSGRVA